MFGPDRFKSIKKQGSLIFNSRFLENFTSLERYEFLQLCHRRSYNEQEYIYYQGDPGTGMYFIEEGQVQLIVEAQLAGNSESPERATLTIAPPESFGALSIGYELRRMSSAKCLTDCTLLGFFKPDFDTLKKRHPAIAVKFMETLAMIAMKQLEISNNAIKNNSGKIEAAALQLSTYYNKDLETEAG